MEAAAQCCPAESPFQHKKRCTARQLVPQIEAAAIAAAGFIIICQSFCLHSALDQQVVPDNFEQAAGSSMLKWGICSTCETGPCSPPACRSRRCNTRRQRAGHVGSAHLQLHRSRTSQLQSSPGVLTSTSAWLLVSLCLLFPAPSAAQGASPTSPAIPTPPNSGLPGSASGPSSSTAVSLVPARSPSNPCLADIGYTVAIGQTPNTGNLQAFGQIPVFVGSLLVTSYAQVGWTFSPHQIRSVQMRQVHHNLSRTCKDKHHLTSSAAAIDISLTWFPEERQLREYISLGCKLSTQHLSGKMCMASRMTHFYHQVLQVQLHQMVSYLSRCPGRLCSGLTQAKLGFWKFSSAGQSVAVEQDVAPLVVTVVMSTTAHQSTQF